MFRAQGSRVPGSVLAAGGLLWFAKLVVIVSTGGRVVDTGAAAALYLLGVLALVVGAILLGYWLTDGQRLLVRIVASAAAGVGFVVTFLILDVVGRSIIGERGPEYAPGEAGILLTTVLAMVVGAWLWVREAERTDASLSSQS